MSRVPLGSVQESPTLAPERVQNERGPVAAVGLEPTTRGVYKGLGCCRLIMAFCRSFPLSRPVLSHHSGPPSAGVRRAKRRANQAADEPLPYGVPERLAALWATVAAYPTGKKSSRLAVSASASFSARQESCGRSSRESWRRMAAMVCSSSTATTSCSSGGAAVSVGGDDDSLRPTSGVRVAGSRRCHCSTAFRRRSARLRQRSPQ